MEVKKSGHTEGSDLIKLGFMMRKMLVALINEKVETPVVFGLVVSGMVMLSTKQKFVDGFYVVLIGSDI